MSVRICYVCDEPILRGEPRIYLDSLSIHEYCDPEGEGRALCSNTECGYRWTTHAGKCLD